MSQHPLVEIRQELSATATRLKELASETYDYRTRSQASIACEEILDTLEGLDLFIKHHVRTPVTF